MTNATCSNRPRRYHTGGGLWEKPLEVLARYGHTDIEIAFILSRLTREALRTIFRMEAPTDDDIEALAVPEGVVPGPLWTQRKVRHHRRRLRIMSRVRHEDSLKKYWCRGHMKGPNCAHMKSSQS